MPVVVDVVIVCETVEVVAVRVAIELGELPVRLQSVISVTCHFVVDLIC